MKKIVLFGAGERAEKFLVKWHKEIKIAGIFDNRKEGIFYGHLIEKPFYEENLFIIAATDNYKTYMEIRQQLLLLGYREFEEFIPHTIYKKKMVVIHGNCHMSIVKQYLEKSREFNSVYGFYPFPQIQYIPNDLDIFNIIGHCDYFMYQDIRRENGYGERYSSVEMLKYINSDCNKLSLPNLHVLPKCFFPQLLETEMSKLKYRVSDRIDGNIKRWYEEKRTIDDMITMIECGGVYDKLYIENLWEDFKRNLCEREQGWDIKISDYILSHYKTEKLFTNLKHISTGLAKEIANRILRKLDLPYLEEKENMPALDEYEVFIYRDVKEALGLEFDEKNIRISSKVVSIDNSAMNLRLYVQTQLNILSFQDWCQDIEEKKR